jgi:hypothetical protein
MAEVTLNWATAEVEEAKLTVGLEGKIPSGWKKSFERTVRLLGRGDWGKVRIKKQAVRVSAVTPGSEDKLRHHLEGVIEQANAAHRSTEGESERQRQDADTDDGSPDARMAERFRSFADQDLEAETKPG